MANKIQIKRDATDTHTVIRHGTDDSGAFVPQEPTVGARFSGEMLAVGDGSGGVQIFNLDRNTPEIGARPFGEYVDGDGNAYGADEAGTVNAINAALSGNGVSAPTITSPSTLTVQVDASINFTLTGVGIAGVEWGALPSGVAVSSLNRRQLLGAPDTVGSYTISGVAVNAAGATSFSISLTVTAAPFANVKSVRFLNQQYMGANASLLDPILGRSGNGSGASDAWTVAIWFNGSTDNQGQTIFYFGDQDTTNGGFVELRQTNVNGAKRIRMRYGSNANHIQMTTPAGSITPGTWQQIVVAYDGGTTGASSGSLSAYYGRFSIYIDGALQTTNNTHSNFGYSGGIDPDNFRIGRFSSGSHLRDAKVDEVAIWGSDQSGSISDIYNSGLTFDLSTLTTAPDHWWRMGDGDTYPTIQDNVGTAHFVMYNMTAASIVNSAPPS